MPVHTAAWNNLSPVGSDLASSIDDFMRAMKVDIDERMSLQHYWADAIAVGNDQDGTHKEITITPATTNTPLLKTNANQSLTGSDASSTIDLGVTWNTTGEPKAIKLNVTNTASGATALLFDLQVGGTSMFRVTKAGNVVIAGTSTLTGNTTLGAGSGNPTLVINGNGNQIIEFQAASVASARITNSSGNEYWDSNGNWAWRSLNAVTNRMTLTSAGVLTTTSTMNATSFILSANNTYVYGRNTAVSAIPLAGIDTSNNIHFGDTNGASVVATFLKAGQLITFSVGGTSFWHISSAGVLYPNNSNAVDLGTSSARVRVGYFQSLNVTNAPGISGVGNVLELQGSPGAGAGITLRSGAAGGGSNISLVTSSTIPASALGPTISIGRNSNGAGPVSGAIAFENVLGTTYYLWVDNAGKLRIHTSSPASADTGGTVVGAQS
jgi:hypothetical protein